ncbi:glycosyltransferase [Caballeronia glebae]|nr:glycosyltransferase [Caballeronia glebae]
MPLISCIMPTYGRPAYVDEAVAMFLAQDYPNKELIIVNSVGKATICTTIRPSNRG